MHEVTGKVLNDGREFNGAIMDIAVGGLSLRSDSSLTVGDTLRLMLPALGDIPALTVDCTIRWNKWLEDRSTYQVGCGFKFDYKIDEDRIARYVNQLHTNRVTRLLTII